MDIVITNDNTCVFEKLVDSAIPIFQFEPETIWVVIKQNGHKEAIPISTLVETYQSLVVN
jgi:hypothetical protein